MLPQTKQEFKMLMEEIDNLLRKRDIPIYDRPIHSWSEIAKKLKVSFNFPSVGKAIPGIYNKDNLCAHISNWYNEKYGERLKVRMAVGSGIILIRNDPWRVFFPLVFGTVYFACDPNLDKYKNSPSITTNGKPHIINILNLIDDMPNEYAKQLTISELNEINQIFLSGLDALSHLDMIKSKPLIKEAKVDLENAVNNILSNQAHYGQSKWASLQFSEKLLKSFLLEKSGEFPKTHILSDLYRLASNYGLPQIKDDVFARVQCSPGARYGDEKVDLDEAVKAHYASLRICCFSSKGIVS